VSTKIKTFLVGYRGEPGEHGDPGSQGEPGDAGHFIMEIKGVKGTKGQVGDEGELHRCRNSHINEKAHRLQIPNFVEIQ
jgi:hypothetical protein